MLVYHMTDNPDFHLDTTYEPFDILDGCGYHGHEPRGVLFAVADKAALRTVVTGYTNTSRHILVTIDISGLTDEEFVQGQWLPEEVIIIATQKARVVSVEHLDSCVEGHEWRENGVCGYPLLDDQCMNNWCISYS